MQKRTRSLFLSKAVQERWRVFKADVKAALLQGNNFKDEEQRYALPPAELAKHLEWIQKTNFLYVQRNQYMD